MSDRLKIRIETNGEVNSRNWKFYIGGIDVSGFIRGAVVSAKHGEPVIVSLDFVNVIIDQPKAAEEVT